MSNMKRLLDECNLKMTTEMQEDLESIKDLDITNESVNDVLDALSYSVYSGSIYNA